MIDLGCITNQEVVQRLVNLGGKTVIDAGCGSMTFTKILAELGAHVVAVDPDPIQAARNREQPITNIEFFESCASSLPVKDNSIDGVFFSYSLHHIAESLYHQVFDEVFRVLNPDGFLYVIEPIDCPLNQVMKLFHDEDAERNAAWTALNEIARPRFQECNIVTYHGFREYGSWEAFAENFSSRSFNSGYTANDVVTPDVKAAFERHAGPNGRFVAPKNVMHLQTLRHSP